MDKCIAAPTERSKKLIGAALFAVYAVITFIGATHHELWLDEAQAWEIARDSTISGLPEVLKQEGHPGLWHLILMPFAKAGMYCEVINIISWFISVVAAGLFVCKAPFGLVFKAAMLFSSGFLFFNSVNSRVYCLIPLLLFLIAIVYPKRDKYAPIYGLLVGLLANTHIMMCGLVGILGIYMLIELFCGIKQEGLKKNLGRIAGLAIAGVLVIAMILPLIGSLETNRSIQFRTYTFGNAFEASITIFQSIGKNLMVCGWENLPAYLFSCTIGVVIFFVFVLLFCYRKAFITATVFLVFFTLASGIIWFVMPARAINFIYTLVAIYWIAKENEKPRIIKIEYNRSSESLISKLTSSLIRAISNPEKTISVLLSVILFSSSASGVFWLFYDYGHDYSLSEKTAQFIVENIPEDSVIVMTYQNGASFEAYTHGSGVSYYSIYAQEYCTYTPLYYNGQTFDYDKIIRDLKDKENIYFLSDTYRKATNSDYSNMTYPEPVFSSEIYADAFARDGRGELYRVTLDDVLEIAKNYELELMTR